MMMSFYKKSVHSFLGSTITMDDRDRGTYDDDKFSTKHGLGLITATSDAYRTPNVIESSVVRLLPPPLLPPSATLFNVFSAKKDPGGIGFIDDIGGGVDGLMSCTESLGFESCDERIFDDHHQMEEIGERRNQYSSSRHKWRNKGNDAGGGKREVKKFPPPLSSFNRNGQPSYFRRSVKTDGRLELTEIRINRPEILRASRQDGRLRLHLIREYEVDAESEDEENQQQEEEEEEEENEEEEEEVEEEEEEEEERIGEWKLEGFRRCNEMMGHHDYHHQNICHHHTLHVWSQHCVSTR